MYLTKEKLIALWRKRKDVFAEERNGYIVKRFDWVNQLFNEIFDTTIDYNNGVSINGSIIKDIDGKNPDSGYFSVANDNLTAEGAFNGVFNMMEKYPEYKDIISRIGCLLGGFDADSIPSIRMIRDYCIVSAIITGSSDNGDIPVVNMARKMSSNLADNNYFFNVIETINRIKHNEFSVNESKFVLMYPHSIYKNYDDAEEKQKKALNHRFPYKFFWMWANKDKVLHFVGLDSYRRFINDQSDEFKYAGDKNFNQAFSDFIGENGWKKFSDTIINYIPEGERGNNYIEELSKLLSILMAKEQDIRSLDGLIKGGCKAIILWGPPGTGKTYHAQQLILQLLNIYPANDVEVFDEWLEKWHFSASNKKIEQEGAWALVQFHPNYTYEDFIGGISPKLDGNAIAYTLKTGIFKEFCDLAAKTENKEKSFVFIIDEINRADLSAVFGELLYAIEYRNRKISLPNFQDKFTIPDNVFIIGTMNNVDKSLVTFDLALRRRFSFFKIMPNMDALYTILDKIKDVSIDQNSLSAYVERCKELNKSLISNNSNFGLNENHQIGHAYFGKIKDYIPKGNNISKITPFELEQLWVYNLEPLIEEYLGGRIDDTAVKNSIDDLKKDFIKPLS